MTTNPPAGGGLLTLRSEWRRRSAAPAPAALHIGLLASYTIDSLVPYLGMGLADAGLPARLTVGPFNQIMQECLGDGEIARLRPDVVVVAPRFEEMGAAGPGWRADLLAVADAALDAAARWGGCLVFVLPALPETGQCGVSEAGLTSGVVAEATRAREALRARLGGRPDVCVADAEQAVRAVGNRRAHHPAMFRFAKVPYTEELFATLGEQLARLLALRFGSRFRAAVVDADSLVLAAGESPAEREAAAGALREPLLELHRAGIRIGLRGSRDPDAVWASLATGFPEFGRDLVDGCVLDTRPIGEQLDLIAAEAGMSSVETVLLTADPAGVPEPARPTVVLGGQPETWVAELRAAGLFDQPVPPVLDVRPDPSCAVGTEIAQAAARDQGAPTVGGRTSVDDFVAGLNISVAFQPARQGHLDKVAELVERAKDFTLGIRHTAADIDRRADEIIAITVRDRLGDYGVGGAVALRCAAGVGTVDLFSLSCPVLGKRVEDVVLAEILDRADRAGCDAVVFRYNVTEHNEHTVRFLRDAARRPWLQERDRRQIRIEVAEADRPPTVMERSSPAPDRPAPEPAVPFGVVSFGHVLTEPVDVAAAAAAYTADVDRVRGWEYRRFHRAARDVGITDLAVEAGRRALAAASLDAASIDLVVLAISDLAEYLYWDPAAAVQARLGAHGAEALLLNQACGGGVAAFDLVAGKLAAHPAYHNALIIGANRVCETYWNRMEINTSIYSDGAAAAVVRRGHGSCRWLATEIVSDGRYADFMRMDLGGAARPFSPDDPAPVQVRSPFDRLDEFFDGDVRRMLEFVKTIRSRNRKVIEAACARAGVSYDDIRRVIHLNDNVKQLTELAGDLGIPVERTNVELAAELGHVGCADQLLSLERQMATGDLAVGDLVALTSTGSGMHWVCTLLRI